MFDVKNFTLPSETQQLKFDLTGEVPEMSFGLYSEDKTVKAKDIKTIAFGVVNKDNVKERHGSIIFEQDYILVLAMDNREEYRAKDKWDCIYFLNKLLLNNFDWAKSLEEMFS